MLRDALMSGPLVSSKHCYARDRPTLRSNGSAHNEVPTVRALVPRMLDALRALNSQSPTACGRSARMAELSRARRARNVGGMAGDTEVTFRVAEPPAPALMLAIRLSKKSVTT